MATVPAHNSEPEPAHEQRAGQGHRPWTYALRLPHDPRAARVARTTLRAVLGSHGMAHLSDTAELLGGELVANAYRHTGGPSELRLGSKNDGRLRVSVWDTDPVIPYPFDKPPCPYDHRTAIADARAAADHGAESGRGLLLVRLCASSWGAYPIRTTTHTPGGKLLWFELSPHPGDRGRYTIAA